MTGHTSDTSNAMLNDDALEAVSGGGWGVSRTVNGPKEMWNLRPGESIQFRPERRGDQILMFNKAGQQVGKPKPYTREDGEFLGV